MTQSSTIPFIYLEQQKFRISQEAKEFLSSIKQPVGVLVIVGKYRTGKSLFLNRIMLQSKQAFKVSPTIHSCTKGLWMWKGTIKCTQQDNPTPQTTPQPTKQIIVIDTEGFGATEQSDNYNNKILLFALLLSSYFVYNSVGSIDENSLNNISVLANIANEIQSKNAKQQNLESQFPSFMWLVRDFTLNLVDKNNLPISPKQYLQQSLQLQKGTSSMIQSKNKIRRMVKHFFVERDCFTLVRPVETEEQLQQLDTLEEKDFRQEFVEQARRLRERILGRVKVKKLRNQMVMDGARLLELAQNYVEVVNGGGLPNLEASYRHLVRVQANNIRKRLLRQYQNKLQLHMAQHLANCSSYTQYQQHTQPIFHQFQSHLTIHLSNSLPQQQSSTILTQSLKHLNQFIPQLYLKYKQHLTKVYLGLVQEMKEDNLMRLEEELAGVRGREGLKEWLDGKMGEVRGRFLEQVREGKVPGFVLGEIEEQCFGKEFGEEVERRYVEIETKKMLRHNQQLQTKLYSKQQLIKQYINRISTLQHHLQASHTTTTTLQTRNHFLQHQLTTTQTQLLTLETTLTQQLQQLTSQNQQLNITLQQQKANIEMVKQQLCEEIREKRQECERVGKELVVCEERLRVKEREGEMLREEVQRLRLSLTQSQNTLSHLTTQLQSLNQSKQLLTQQYLTSQHSSTQLIDNLHNIITDLSTKLSTSTTTLSSQVRMIELLNVEIAEIKQKEKLILESNTGLVNTVGGLEARLRESDSRVEQYKVYKKMFKNAASVQCKNCDRFFLPTVFNVHLQVCTSFCQNHQPTNNPTNESNPSNHNSSQPLHPKLNYHLRKPLTQPNKPIQIPSNTKQKKHSPGQFFKIWEQKQSIKNKQHPQ